MPYILKDKENTVDFNNILNENKVKFMLTSEERI